jgi:restriction system protein
VIPDFQTLLLPVLECTRSGEQKMADIVRRLADEFALTPEERVQLIPSGRAKTFTNRVHWARYYLKEAGLVESQRRAHISITPKGLDLLSRKPDSLSAAELRAITTTSCDENPSLITDNSPASTIRDERATPDEIMAAAHHELQEALSSDLLDALRNGTPQFFENVIVHLLIAMGYGGADGQGAVLGGAGDNGVDGVIDKDPLGVDQVYVQAKRYGAGTSVGPAEIRDFFGALSLKDVSRGIFVTSSVFTASARQTAEKLGARIVLIDGPRLAQLMIAYRVGCRVKETYVVSELDEEFFE